MTQRSLLFFALGTAIAVLGACSAEAPASRAPIVSGSEGGPSAVVAVIHTRADGTRQLCSGTLVAPSIVLTAKHCVFEDVGGSEWTPIPASRLSITLGADIVGAPGDEHSVASIDTTDGPYRDGDGAVGGDVALLLLASAPALSPVAIDARAPTTGTTIRIVGFGYTEAGGGGTLGTRHEGEAAITSLSTGTFTSEGAQWTCTGDSGGPALDAASGAVIGVTSIGPRGCRTSSSIYTRLDANLALLARHDLVSSPSPDASMPTSGDASVAPSADAGIEAPAPSSDGCACHASSPHRAARAISMIGVVLALALGRRRAGISARGSGSRTRPRR